LIPLGDVDRKPKVFPVVTTVVIAANALMFFFELSRGGDFVQEWAVIPREIASGNDLLTILTAMFMHAGWLHIGGNMIYFWAFGPELEDLMGRFRFIAFYLAGGLVATLAQVMYSPNSQVPELGASGAIAAVMGAFLVTFPKDRIRTIVFLGFFFMMPFIPAIILVGFWLLIQIFSQVGSVAAGQTDGVAYMAHIGGFLFGMLTARLFEPRSKRKGMGLEG